MIEHKFWKGRNYQSGIHGERFAIVGYSHYDDGTDTPEFTNGILEKVAQGWRLPFFVQIAGYFNRENDFWNDVAFFNFIPNLIGQSANKFASGSNEQIDWGKARTLRILDEIRPQKVLVFSRKAWNGFPPTDEERAGSPNNAVIGLTRPFECGTYKIDGHTVLAAGLRHPLGADFILMSNTVTKLIAATQSG